MLLATLIPSIVYAYEQILNVVDEEVSRAVAERRRVVFRLHGLGGVWGMGGNDDDDMCNVTSSFRYKEMEPVMWRLTVRALLKTDVYGISGGCHGSEMMSASDPFHLGLKDIVLLMENKSKARHALIDAMVEAGVWKFPQCSSAHTNKSPEPPTCMRVISIARSSVEGLLIA